GNIRRVEGRGVASQRQAPYWLRKPSGDDIAAVYPREAALRGLDGAGAIQCEVGPQGSMTSCVIVEESPAGYGFGLAALKLSTRFKLKPMERDGVPVSGGTIKIPIRFRLPR
ncbi:MAG: energy transducer TonB, partial [Phenylobacterium sp.]